MGFHSKEYQVGDYVIYLVTKRTAHPTPLAKEIIPEPNGEDYLERVKKYWIVEGVTPEGVVRCYTRTGKLREVSINDPNLRKATFWERIIHRSRGVSDEVRFGPKSKHLGEVRSPRKTFPDPLRLMVQEAAMLARQGRI